MESKIPTLADLQKFSVNRAGQSEVIRQSLYDHLLYPTAGITQLNFFQQPAGQGNTTASGVAAGSAKSLADTNMTLAGQLAAPVNQIVESIEVSIEPGSVSTANTFTLSSPVTFVAAAAVTALAHLSDVNALRQTGYLRFYIGSKDYLQEAPIGRFPAKCSFDLEGSISTNSATVGEVSFSRAAPRGRPY